MRNMSFAFTTEQIRNQTKTVTRRLGWKFLEEGDLVQPVVKGMGLKRGEKIQKIGPPIRIRTVTWEPLSMVTDNECVLEGFPGMDRLTFIHMFSRHSGAYKKHTSGLLRRIADIDRIITRIDFEYTDGPEAGKT